MISTSNLIEQVIEAWQNMQAKTPLVQCITNSVAANYTANVLLASGASPAMIDNPYEAESFTKISSALSINLGTPTSEQMQAMQISAKTAQLNNVPWVLDPVGYGAILAWRSQMTDELLQFKPSVIRGNASEISTLAGNQVQSKGVDSTLSSDQAYQQAYALLAHADCIAISGESDYILSRELDAVIQVNGGSPLQPKITATGCALGALIAAYSAVTTPTIAALSAHIHFAIAGKLAANQAQTMGSFSSIFMDYIHMLDANLIEQYADIKLLNKQA
ncbi:phosphomethylpyrimidine kinase family protein [Acinetobacter baumannii 1598530]|uniref:hydroxyethylthiazole kinase n=1 Tax=Acinetobacter baumannii TaxID=470 RepID=UPI000461393E|nr:hydroxyethylthiazole kinase [Acinetobacter baumannii]KCY09623.1 phosphomethylpyrimidine kinase family protein [Acinetobacter baumannii 1598530]TPV30664.1 hydroxyethylthiazole kinase [Acinetobacter baumannii]CAI3109315.1 Hydroxyethylthiazole kinase [Acinetobacter baumannii]